MGKKELIEEGKAYLGIEFGSTRIKAVACDEAGDVLAIGGFGWENSLVDGIWTYSEEEIFAGLKACYADLVKDISEYGLDIEIEMGKCKVDGETVSNKYNRPGSYGTITVMNAMGDVNIK